MAGVIQTGIRIQGKHLRDAFHVRWTGILSLLPVRFAARLAVRREILRNRNAIARTLGIVLDLPLDQLSRNPLYCVRVRHELIRELRLLKKFPPGWRKACFQASARRFGRLT
jgi:hypothetical protein